MLTSATGNRCSVLRVWCAEDLKEALQLAHLLAIIGPSSVASLSMFALLRFLFSVRKQVDKHTVPFEHSRDNLQLPLHLPLKPFAPLCYFLSSFSCSLFFAFSFLPFCIHLLPTFFNAPTLGARLNAHANLILFPLVLGDSIRFKLSLVFFFIILFTVTLLLFWPARVCTALSSQVQKEQQQQQVTTGDCCKCHCILCFSRVDSYTYCFVFLVY